MSKAAAPRIPTAADVADAARLLAGIAVRTPLLQSAALDALTGGRIFLKPEPLQRTVGERFDDRAGPPGLCPLSRRLATVSEPHH